MYVPCTISNSLIIKEHNLTYLKFKVSWVLFQFYGRYFANSGKSLNHEARMGEIEEFLSHLKIMSTPALKSNSLKTHVP